MLKKSIPFVLIFAVLLLSIIGLYFLDKAFAEESVALEQPKSSIVSLIQQANYAEAQKQTQKLIASYPGHPDLPQTLFWIAEAYFWSGKHDQAKDLHQQIIQNFPDSPQADKARLAYSRTEVLSLIGSNKLEQAEEARKALAHWNFVYAWLQSQN